MVAAIENYKTQITNCNPDALKTERDKLIISCLPMVIHYAKRSPLWPEYADDLISVGNEALCKCADRYDPSKGKFSNIAAFWIQGYQKNYARTEKAERLVTGTSRNHHNVKIVRLDDDDDIKSLLEKIPLNEMSIDDKAVRKQHFDLIFKELGKIRKKRGHRNPDIFLSILEGMEPLELSQKYLISTSTVYKIYRKQFKEILVKLKPLTAKKLDRKTRLSLNARRHYYKNKAKRIKEISAWRKKHPDKMKEYHARYRKKNKVKRLCKDGAFSKRILSEHDVVAVKKHLLLGNLTQDKIAEMFNVDRRTISAINTGKAWSHIKI